MLGGVLWLVRETQAIALLCSLACANSQEDLESNTAL